MADNSRKTPLAATLDVFARRKAQNAINLLGKALPCSVVSVAGAIVTVKFELKTDATIPNVTVPIFGSIYARAPTQVGDKGVVFPADAYIGGVSGLGGGVADLSQRANLSALVFFPIGNKAWAPSPDANAYLLQGPNGVILRDTGNGASITVTPSGISIKVGGTEMIKVDGTNVTINGKIFLTHAHSGVQTGGGNTGGVT